MATRTTYARRRELYIGCSPHVDEKSPKPKAQKHQLPKDHLQNPKAQTLAKHQFSNSSDSFRRDLKRAGAEEEIDDVAFVRLQPI